MVEPFDVVLTCLHLCKLGVVEYGEHDLLLVQVPLAVEGLILVVVIDNVGDLHVGLTTDRCLQVRDLWHAMKAVDQPLGAGGLQPQLAKDLVDLVQAGLSGSRTPLDAGGPVHLRQQRPDPLVQRGVQVRVIDRVWDILELIHDHPFQEWPSYRLGEIRILICIQIHFNIFFIIWANMRLNAQKIQYNISKMHFKNLTVYSRF